jgi:hypothetical protein
LQHQIPAIPLKRPLPKLGSFSIGSNSTHMDT